MVDLVRRHWPLLIVAAAGMALILTDLGSDYLWEDEGDTAVLALSVVKHGVPKAWDGVTFFDSDKGTRETENLTMVSHPWLQFYVTALSFRIFGESAFAARLPFALAGVMTILLVYLFVWQVTSNRWSSFCAAALLVLSVPFLLYSRQCRNYSLNMLFTCCAVFIFFGMNSWRRCALFVVAAVLLFHSSPIGIVVIGALGGLALLYPPFAGQRRWFCLGLPFILVATIPWLAIAHSAYSENTQLAPSVGTFSLRFVRYLMECTSVAPLIGTAILGIVCLVQSRKVSKNREKSKSVPDKARDFFVLILSVLFCYALAIAATQASVSIWFLGLRYTPAVIPFAAMAAGIVIVKFAGGRPLVWIPLLLVFGLTKMALLTPWVCRDQKDVDAAAVGGMGPRGAHVPESLIDCFIGNGQLAFIRDLGRKNLGIVGEACGFFRANANSDDVLITNYGWEPLYFYTRLPQALKILPDYPVYAAAKRNGVPEQNFGVDHVKWVFWRFQWEGYLGYRWADLIQEIQSNRGRLIPVAAFEESRWENRENIYFHRFSGGNYLYPWPKRLPSGVIFRVDWSEAQ
jgi:hypothetical protein